MLNSRKGLPADKARSSSDRKLEYNGKEMVSSDEEKKRRREKVSPLPAHRQPSRTHFHTDIQPSNAHIFLPIFILIERKQLLAFLGYILPGVQWANIHIGAIFSLVWRDEYQEDMAIVVSFSSKESEKYLLNL